MSVVLWLFVTVAAYEFGRWLRKRTAEAEPEAISAVSPLAQPVAVAIVIVGTLLVRLLRTGDGAHRGCDMSPASAGGVLPPLSLPAA